MAQLLPPEGVLFDMGGTLIEEIRFDIPAGRARLLSLARDLNGITVEAYNAISDRLYAMVEPVRQASLLEFPVPQFHRLMRDRLGLRFDQDDATLEREFYLAATDVVPTPGVREMLEDLRARGLRLGVVSNSSFSARTLSEELERQGLLDFFAFVMSSADYGLRKPHPFLFEVALSRLGTSAASTWMAGDSLRWDVAGALAAGMAGIWYNPLRLAPAACAPEAAAPDAEIAHWAELKALFTNR